MKKRMLEITMNALNEYYEKRYNEKAKEGDRNNCLRIAIEAAEVANYIKENLK